MATRFFTADFHLQMPKILEYENRPFNNIEHHDRALIGMCKKMTSYDDMIIHIGDLYSFGIDRGVECGKKKPIDVLKDIPASFINIRGNHDLTNKVKSACDSMQLQLGRRYPNVVCGHYPSYSEHAKSYVRKGWILLCGHVHRQWHYCLDLTNSVLNINVGVDSNDYKLISEDQLIKYIDKVLAIPMDKMNKIRIVDGKAYHV